MDFLFNDNSFTKNLFERNNIYENHKTILSSKIDSLQPSTKLSPILSFSDGDIEFFYILDDTLSDYISISAELISQSLNAYFFVVFMVWYNATS